ncbi:MAG TPA: helix-turn-helix domain-containing protein, partial [Acidimicrobiales bacterium]|nr:helix-turn-helix domain-containing protein [Acidimicrobiales bacterium]
MGPATVYIDATNGRAMTIDIVKLMADSSTRLLIPGDRAEPGGGVRSSNLTDEEAAELQLRLAHTREVLCGYSTGNSILAQAGEPREGYEPSRRLIERIRRKAKDLGLNERTIKRWVRRYVDDGPDGLINRRRERRSDPTLGVDSKWLEEVKAQLAANEEGTTLSKKTVLTNVEVALDERYGEGKVPLPKRSKAYDVLTELTARTCDFSASAKRRSSIAATPNTAHRGLIATRVGEMLLLDTTRLDVLAVDPVTGELTSLDLTVALDAKSKCIVGFRLTPVGPKAIDAAAVLFESLRPWSRSSAIARFLPYAGVPEHLLIPPEKLDAPIGKGLPAVNVETIVVDHGKIYISNALLSCCHRFGIDVQPARKGMGADKADIERWFRTVRQGLLEYLVGYKGPDIRSRGKDVEALAWLFPYELEAIIREWIVEVYHHTEHDDLYDPRLPDVHFTPLEAYEEGIARAGGINVPLRADLVYEFLPVQWRTIQDYGVEIGAGRGHKGSGLRYSHPVL